MYAANMVKRSCPFTDDLNPQVKIHVREKEVANGALRNQLMKNVYDRTKDLLFFGARKIALATPPMESHLMACGSIMNGFMSNGSCAGNSMKQLQLTSHGQLSMSSDVQVQPIQKFPCSTCSMWNQSEMKSCSFCDKALCPPCSLVCIKCLETVCSVCSFNVYDVSEGNICRNCY